MRIFNILHIYHQKSGGMLKLPTPLTRYLGSSPENGVPFGMERYPPPPQTNKGLQAKNIQQILASKASISLVVGMVSQHFSAYTSMLPRVLFFFSFSGWPMIIPG